MIIRDGLFTSESVSEGHPDKLADQISDAILDRFLELDPQSRVACETMVADGFVVVAGEFRTRRHGTFEQVRSETDDIVRAVLIDAGYTDATTGIDPQACEVVVRFSHQSPDIHQGVELEDGEIGAGDQGMMFGYATNETAERLPLPLVLAHRLMKQQAEMRKSGLLPWLRPDAKSQVTVRYANRKPIEVTAVVLSTQHEAGVSQERVQVSVKRHIIDPVLAGYPLAENLAVYINPTGKFVIGGPKGDTGLTGRKIVVDTYGGIVPHGGGAFSGKDPTKVDRSAAYMARFLANQVVGRGLARRCLVQLAYSIGVAQPVSFTVETFGTAIRSKEFLEAVLRKEFDLSPAGIMRQLNLLQPIYRPTASYGHFGRPELALPWEAIFSAPIESGPAKEELDERRQMEMARWEASLRDMPMFVKVIRAAKSRQHNSLTRRQYNALYWAFMGMEEGPCGWSRQPWTIQRRKVLNSVLEIEGLTVRPITYPVPHAYRLKESGMRRLVELEKKIVNAKKRQQQKHRQA